MKSSRLPSDDGQQQRLALRGPETHFRVEDLARQKSFSGALALGASVAGLDLEKEVHIPLGIDAGHWTRIRSGSAGTDWQKLEAICDLYGNDAPILWMLYQRGYDLHSLRKRETETERALREAKERIEGLERDKRVLVEALSGRAA